jgi:succinate dehydrogenase / fumarate reductase cytochrome b subunit
MIHTAIIITIFLVIHMLDFYFKSRYFGEIPTVLYDGKEYHDMGILVIEKFKIPSFVVIYILSFLILAFHLFHGFQSAFQTLGLNHKVYTPVIKSLGVLYTLLVTAGFILIPVYIYFWM